MKLQSNVTRVVLAWKLCSLVCEIHWPASWHLKTSINNSLLIIKFDSGFPLRRVCLLFNYFKWITTQNSRLLENSGTQKFEFGGNVIFFNESELELALSTATDIFKYYMKVLSVERLVDFVIKCSILHLRSDMSILLLCGSIF